MKEAIFRLGRISILVIFFLFALLVLLANVKDPAIIRTHKSLKHMSEIELWDKLPVKHDFYDKINRSKKIIGLHLYPSKNFWIASSRIKDKTYFTKKDLKTNVYIRWSGLLKKYPYKKFFVYIHSQNPVDLFKFIKTSEKFKNRLLIYSDFLKTAAWFRKESAAMAIGASPTVLLRMNFFSRLWVESLVPVRAHFAYIQNKKIRFNVLKELKRRRITMIINKNLINNEKKQSKNFFKFVESTLESKNYMYLIKNRGI
ncbi:MAG: hypothetical protein HAW60_02610 [Bdellovibrionales bacterium]|nr:hypothetical protein [Bdellovibrionales bacterium]